MRTLHHYDRIGLLVPSRRSEQGYRLYDYGDLERLRQIRLLCDLRFSLDAIRQLLDAPAYDRRSALVAQRELLRERQKRTDRIIRGVDRALTAMEEETEMDRTEMFEGLEEFDHEQYRDEAEERWGDTDAYKESMRRTRRYGKNEWARIREEGETVVARLAELMAEGGRAAGRAAMDLAEEHRCHIDRWFYPCNHHMHRCLAEMYTDDAALRGVLREAWQRAGRFCPGCDPCERRTVEERPVKPEERSTRFRMTLGRVLLVQVVTLALLWLLQATYHV